MSDYTRRTWTAMLATTVFGGKALARDGKQRSKWREVAPRDRIRERYFPNVPLVTHEGKTVRFYDDLIKDKIVVINFMYATCEGVCPTVMANLAKVQKALGDRVGRDMFIYSISLKPEQDTPGVLKEHAKMVGVKPGWLLLTGKPQDIETLRRSLGFVDPDPALDRDTSNHIGNLRYGNEPLQLWASCPGMSNPDWILRSILWMDRPDKPAATRTDSKR